VRAQHREYLTWPEPGETYTDPATGAVVLILAAPAWPGVLRCNGVSMLRCRRLPCSYHSNKSGASDLRAGSRYRDVVSGLEVRCLRAGHGQLTFDQEMLGVA
jgi:hypothetical protein